MAGFRTFATGEVLTAANVNDFLMKQSVMVFADADARTAALGAEVTEGMLTFNLDTGQLEVFNGTDFVEPASEPPAPPAGIGSNVVQASRATAFTVNGNVYTDVTNLSATITPSSATAKILVILSLALGTNSNTGATARLLRSSTPIGVSTDGNPDATISIHTGSDNEILTSRNYSATVLDSPATASAVTYKVQIAATASNNVAKVNRANEGRPGSFSALTLIEVAA